MTNSLWKTIYLVVDGVEYRIVHDYIELLNILDCPWLFQIREKYPVWNIKNLGTVTLMNLEFNQPTGVLRIIGRTSPVPVHISHSLVVVK